MESGCVEEFRSTVNLHARNEDQPTGSPTTFDLCKERGVSPGSAGQGKCRPGTGEILVLCRKCHHEILLGRRDLRRSIRLQGNPCTDLHGTRHGD